MDLRHLLADLKRRGVYRVAAIYVAGIWALLQVADVLFPVVGIPDWAITSLLIAAAIGFPIAVGLAWLFEVTPSGVVEETDAEYDAEELTLSPARVVEIAVVATLVLLVGYLYVERLTLLSRNAESSVSPGATRPAIAVMPFANLSDDTSADYLAAGLAEEVLNLLSRLDELDVAARTSSFYYQGRDIDLREAGKQLAVSHVLEGSVRRAEGRVRVTAQLVDTESGYRLWSESFDRAYDDSFRLQDDIARRVVGKLELLLSERSQRILTERPELDPQAFDYYLRGREYLRASPSVETLENAVSLLQRATEIDSEYASAFAGLCDAYLDLYELQYKPDDFERGRESCNRALALSDDAPAVLVALGNLYQVSGQQDEAQQHFEAALSQSADNADALIGLAATYHLSERDELAETTYARAIEAQPSNWRAYNGMGGLLHDLGRFEDAIPYYERIIALVPDDAQAYNSLAVAHFMTGDFDRAAAGWARSLEFEPSALNYTNAGSSLFFLGRFAEAAEMYRKAVRLSPDDFESWGALADAHYHLEDPGQGEAQALYDKATELTRARLKINAQDGFAHALLAHFFARLGDRSSALLSIETSRRLAPQDMRVHYNCATALASLGQVEDALTSLRAAVDLGYPGDLVRLDPGFDPLRGSPLFDEWVDSIE